MPGYPAVSLCVALSGGMDSTVLLSALARQRTGRLQLRAVHVDHGLNPNSRAWSRHCHQVAAQLGVPLIVLQARIARARGDSREAVAREARYRLLAEVLLPGEILLTAHHEDDQLETVLLQLFRGAGLGGLAAMPAKMPFGKGWLVRPLLSRSRAELHDWAVAARIAWIDDDSNADETLDRNYLRRSVVPLIASRWKGVASAVSRSARHVAEAGRLLEALARTDVERAAWGVDLNAKALRALPADRRRNALRYWIVRSGAPVPDTRRLEELAGPLIDARPDANPMVCWGNTAVQRHADLLSIHARRAKPATRMALDKTEGATVVWPWRTSPALPLPGDGGKLELKPDARGPVNLQSLPETLNVRWRQGGERLRPRRGGPRRALKSLLQEARLPVAQRAILPLIFAGQTLVAAGGIWLDESIQADAHSSHRGRLVWQAAR